MSIETLEKMVESEGIAGISGAIFKDCKYPSGRTIKANCTVKQYCEEMGAIKSCSGDNYAAELIRMIDAEPIPFKHCSKCNRSELDCFCETPELLNKDN